MRLVHPLRWILVVALGLVLIALEPASAFPSTPPATLASPAGCR